MNKEEFIKRRGKAAYEKLLQQHRDWKVQHPKEYKTAYKRWAAANPEKLKAYNQEKCRKGGKHYEKHLENEQIGLRGERNRIRMKHGFKYRPFKQIIAPESQIHHEWIPDTAEYTGVALVEKDQHMHGFVDVIQILEGKITLLTEEEISKQGVV